MRQGGRLAATLLLLCPSAAGAGPRADQASVSTLISSASLDLGALLKGSSPTTFHIDAHGAVTPRGGDFIRLRGGDVSPQEVSIRCESRRPEACGGFHQVVVTVTGGGHSDWPGRAANFALDAGTLIGAELVSASIGELSSTFVLRCAGDDCGPNPSIRFRLALDVRIDPAPPGAGQAGYYPYVVTAVWQ